MKRLTSFFLIFVLLASAVSGAAFAAENRFATNLRVVRSAELWNDKADGSGRDYATVTVEYRLCGRGIAGIQGVWIAVDLSELLWVDRSEDGVSVQDSIDDGTLKRGASPTKYDHECMYALREKVKNGLTVTDEWSCGAFAYNSAALSADGKTLYIGLQPMQKKSVSYADFTTVMSLRFAVTGDGVSADAIRFVDPAERDSLNQSFIVAMCDGADGFYYGDRSTADTLAAPTVTGDAFVSDNDGGEGESKAETTPPKADEDETEHTTENSGVDNTPPEQAWKNPFRDVEDDSEYIDAIEFVYECGLFKGTSATEFEPETAMTRAMFVTVLGRLDGVNEKAWRGAAFDDVVAGEWYAPYVKWAASKGIVNGYGDGTFGVDDEVTIEQAVVILARYADYCDVDTSSEKSLSRYADYKKISDWAEDAMKWAVEREIYKGSGGLLRPLAPAKRWLVAELFHKYVTEIE